MAVSMYCALRVSSERPEKISCSIPLSSTVIVNSQDSNEIGFVKSSGAVRGVSQRSRFIVGSVPATIRYCGATPACHAFTTVPTGNPTIEVSRLPNPVVGCGWTVEVVAAAELLSATKAESESPHTPGFNAVSWIVGFPSVSNSSPRDVEAPVPNSIDAARLNCPASEEVQVTVFVPAFTDCTIRSQCWNALNSIGCVSTNEASSGVSQ